MPASTDARIEELCARIRALCREPITPDAETQLRRFAQELRIAIDEHVRRAKVSTEQTTVMVSRDPDKK
ncbi:MAG: hypothetical protein WBW85_16950 [Terriglobales bacterium]